jgi:hypothetical protein
VSLFKKEKSLPVNEPKAMGEAGGEPPGKIHARSWMESTDQVLRPPLLPLFA